MQFFVTVLKNLLGYDGLILLLAVANAMYFLPRLKKSTKRLEEALKPTIYVPIEQIIQMIHPANKCELDLHKLRTLKENETKAYHGYASITNIFPLLGILGTIISLLRLASLSQANVMINFTTALTSTFWGLVCAIVFKAIDGSISPKIELNNDSFNLLINRLDQYTSKGDAHEAKNIS